VARLWRSRADTRSRRSLLRLLAAAGIASAFAVLVGVVIAVLTAGIGDDPTDSGPSNLAITSPPVSQVPADWVPQTSASGIAFRAPSSWTPRADPVVDFRVQPGPGGAPGAEQVGVGISSAADPQAAVTDYATSTYSGQSNYLQQPATDQVSLRGERGREVTVTYSRNGVPVQVVIRGYPTPRGVLLVVSRATTDQPERAGQLANVLDATIRLS